MDPVELAASSNGAIFFDPESQQSPDFEQIARARKVHPGDAFRKLGSIKPTEECSLEKTSLLLKVNRPFLEARILTPFVINQITSNVTLLCPEAEKAEVITQRMQYLAINAISDFSPSANQSFIQFVRHRVLCGLWGKFDERQQPIKCDQAEEYPGQRVTATILTGLAGHADKREQIFEHSQLHGKSPKEIAQLLGLTPTQVSATLQRLRVELPRVATDATFNTTGRWKRQILSEIEDPSLIRLLSWSSSSKGELLTAAKSNIPVLAVKLVDFLSPQILHRHKEFFPADTNSSMTARKKLQVATAVALHQYELQEATLGEFLVDRLLLGLWMESKSANLDSEVLRFISSNTVPGEEETRRIKIVLEGLAELDGRTEKRASLYDSFFLHGYTQTEIAIEEGLAQVNGIGIRLRSLCEILANQTVESLELLLKERVTANEARAESAPRPTRTMPLMQSFTGLDSPEESLRWTEVRSQRGMDIIEFAVTEMGPAIKRKLSGVFADVTDDILDSNLKEAASQAISDYSPKEGGLENFLLKRLYIGVWGPPIVPTTTNNTDVVPGAERVKEIFSIIHRKRPEWIQTFVGYYLEGKSASEIAPSAQVTEHTIYQRLASIREFISADIKERLERKDRINTLVARNRELTRAISAGLKQVDRLGHDIERAMTDIQLALELGATITPSVIRPYNPINHDTTATNGKVT